MSIFRHVPGPPLNQYVDFFWYYVDLFPDHEREHVLPDGTFELIINLQEVPRRLFDRTNQQRHDSFKRGWISGAQSKFLVIDTVQRSSMIGAHFKPGGAAPFLEMPADELGERVVELDAFWDNDIWDWRDRLLAAASPRGKFQILEQLLGSKLARSAVVQNGQKNGITWALDHYVNEPHLKTISSVSERVGYSHKHFIELFRRHTGLTPKLFCRVRRFQKVLIEIQAQRAIDWADIACSCGYFDQAHFVNDFVKFSGLNPTAYLERRLEGERNFTRAL